MTTDLQSRHRQLSIDKGRFFGSVLMKSEKDARHVESIFCAMFRPIRIEETSEYINVEKFRVTAQLADSASYENIARHLLGMIVRMAHNFYPNTVSEKVKVYQSKDYNRYKEVHARHLSGYSKLSLF